MRRSLGSILLIVALLGASAISSDTAAAEATGAAAAPPAAAEQAPDAAAGSVTIANEVLAVTVDVPMGAIASARLPGMYPIKLPEWLDERAVGAAEDEPGPVDVLGPYNPEPPWVHPETGVEQAMHYHSWLVGLPGEESWSVHTHEADALTLTRTGPVGLRFLLRYELAEGKQAVQVRFWAVNTGSEPVPMHYDLPGGGESPWKLVALNGVHQDLGKAEHYYVGVYTWETATADLDGVDLPNEEFVDMRRYEWIAQRSRFFAAFYENNQASRFTLAEGPADGLIPGLLDGSRVAAIGGGNKLGLGALAIPYQTGSGPRTQQQALVTVDFFDSTGQPVRALEPGQGLLLDWTITATGLRGDQLMRLAESKREIEFTNAFYRFFRILSTTMTWLLSKIYAFFAAIGLAAWGYGLAVITLTLLIKLALHRLNFKAQKSMLTMQKIGPELQALKAQYGKEPQVFAQKQMELFRKHGVNPLGGCLPMLLQFPIFIALYQAFSQSAELRGQSFLWIPDLTLPDYTFYLGFELPWIGPATLNVLPILYIAVALWMAFSMKPPTPANPNATGTDKTQQDVAKMMRFLPVVFGFIFYSMPAGLVLYFTVSMVLSVVENRYVRHRLGMT